MSPIRSRAPILIAVAVCALFAAPAVAHAATRVQDDSGLLRYTGRTSHAVALAASGDSRRTLTAGASVEASFTGTSITWVGPKARSLGDAVVYVDGVQAATVGTYGSSTTEQRTLWRADGLTAAPHVVRIVATGKVALDALDTDGVFGQLDRATPLTRVEDANPLLGFTDFIRRYDSPASSGGTAVVGSVSGASTTIAFTGTEIAWIGPRGPYGGWARVRLDGVDQGTVSLYAPGSGAQRVLYSRAGLADGDHTLTITALGLKDRASKGRAAIVDAFDVAGTVSQVYSRVDADDRRVRLSGTWRTVSLGSGEVRLVSGSPSAAAAVVFDGVGARVVADTGPEYGKAEVYADAALVGTVDLYAAVPDRAVVVLDVDGLAPGAHTISVRPTGTRNAASSSDAVSLAGFDVRGLPKVGGAPSGHRRLQASSGYFAKGSGWGSARYHTASGGSVIASSRRGTKLYAAFKGTGFSWVGTRTPKSGRARITIDGKSYGSVSLFSKGYEQQRTIFTANGLAYGTHRVVIEVLGTKEASSAGRAVAVDYLETHGKFVRAVRPSPFNYPWQTYIVIDKSECNLYWVRNGALVKVYRCAVGKHSTPTPNRTWKILMKYHTDPGGIYGPRKMRLFKQSGGGFSYTAYNIHGTNQPWVIGTWASHGCIRMYNRDALELFPQVPIGTMVVTKD